MKDKPIESFTVSLDGYGAGPNQSPENPLGVSGASLHEWAFTTRTLQKQVLGAEGDTERARVEASASAARISAMRHPVM